MKHNIGWVLIGVFIGFVAWSWWTDNAEVREHENALWDAFERGAWAVMMHNAYKGNCGSQAYREIAYVWGSPQNEDDVNELISIALAKSELQWYWRVKDKGWQ